VPKESSRKKPAGPNERKPERVYARNQVTATKEIATSNCPCLVRKKEFQSKWLCGKAGDKKGLPLNREGTRGGNSRSKPPEKEKFRKIKTLSPIFWGPEGASGPRVTIAIPRKEMVEKVFVCALGEIAALPRRAAMGGEGA